jgi:hypothetical protein
MSQEIAKSDELVRLEQRQADEAFFRAAWRTWRQGRTREEAEAKAAWLLATGRPCAALWLSANSTARVPINPLGRQGPEGDGARHWATI